MQTSPSLIPLIKVFGGAVRPPTCISATLSFYQHNHKISNHYLSPTLSKCFSSLNPTTNGIKVLRFVNPTNQPPPLFSTGSVFLNLVALSNSFTSLPDIGNGGVCFQKIFKLSESFRQRPTGGVNVSLKLQLPLVLFMRTRE